MAIDYYQNLTPQERLDKIAQLINKGIYLYYQRNNGEIEKPSPEKVVVSIPKTKRRENTNLESRINLNEKILTTRETMDFLKISRTTLWRLRKRREIPYCVISNRRLIRFKLSEILNYLEINSKPS